MRAEQRVRVRGYIGAREQGDERKRERGGRERGRERERELFE